MSKAWKAMSSVCATPTNYMQWALLVDKCGQVLKQYQAPRLSLTTTCKYLTYWTLRTHIYTKVALCTARKPLPLGGIGVRKLANMNPDQKQWVERFFQHTKTVKSLRRVFRNTVPLELLSCLCCIYSDVAFDAFDTAWVKKYSRYIVAVKNCHVKLFGFEPHPIVALNAACAMLEGRPFHFSDDPVDDY